MVTYHELQIFFTPENLRGVCLEFPEVLGPEIALGY
jgi:hypothetical protein